MRSRLFGKSLVARSAVILLAASIALASTAVANDWSQWGGPNRDFKSPSKGLANSWPEKGPRELWSRALGEGHSSILVDGSRLYTMYSKGEQETVIALDAATGKTVWEHTYPAPTVVEGKAIDYEFGKGPHATPLIVGDMIYTAGATARLHCLNKETGKVVWSHDIYKEYNGTFEDRGYSCSPLAYKNTIILNMGGPGQAIVAFNQKDGSVVWKKQDFMTSPASHMLISVDGQEQLVAFLGKEIVGLDPNNGDLLWSHPHATEWGLNISTPVWGADNLLFVSSAYNGGSRVLRLAQKGGKTTATEVWFHRRVRVHHGNTIRIGDYLYTTSGDFGPAFLTAVNVKTGKVAFQERSFPKSTFILADGKLIILDEDGNLALATPAPDGIKVLAKAQVLQNKAWTVPTLVGTKLYLRDRKTIKALDLS
jgi:outer membrane protein assembly factor BamB